MDLYVAKDYDGELKLFEGKPERYIDKDDKELKYWEGSYLGTVEINELENLKWEDEPRKVFLNTGYNIADQLNHVWAMLKTTQDELTKTREQVIFYRTKLDAIIKLINS